MTGTQAFSRPEPKSRVRSNRVKALKKVDGSVATEQEDIEMEAMNFYQNLFTAQEDLDPDLVCQYVPRKVIDVMAMGFCRSTRRKK